jgi:hypothetical protein
MPTHNVTFHLVIHCGVRVRIQIGDARADASDATAAVRYNWGHVEDTWGRNLRTITFDRRVVRGDFIRLQFMVDAEYEDMLNVFADPDADPDAQMEMPPLAMLYFCDDEEAMVEAVKEMVADRAKAKAEAAKFEELRATAETWQRIKLLSFSVDGVDYLPALQLVHSEMDLCNIPKTAQLVFGPIRSLITI